MAEENPLSDRTRDMKVDDIVRYKNIEIQCKDTGKPRPIQGSKSNEMVFINGVVKIKKLATPDMTYKPAELFLDDEPAAKEEKKEPPESATQTCWHPEQATCPWESSSIPIKDRPYRENRFQEENH